MDKSLGICDRIGSYLSELDKWNAWQNILLGQFLSLLLCIHVILSHFMNKGTVSVMSTGQSFLHYLLLFIIYTTWLVCRRGNGLISVLKARGWKYFLLSLVDVQAKMLISASHQFTSVASIQLLGCVSIPVALVLTCLVLGVRYRMVHIVAISVCLLGVGCLVWTDIEDKHSHVKNQLMGDMLCLGGAVLGTIVTVLQELSVKTTDVIEYLGLLGFFGSIISGTQMFVFEKQTPLVVHATNLMTVLFLITFATIQFIFCSLTSIMVQNTSTLSLLLSFLSSNFYNFVIGILMFGYKTHVLYFLSYFLIMTGIFIFSIKNAPISTQSTSANTPQQTHRSVIETRDPDLTAQHVEMQPNTTALNFMSGSNGLNHSVSSDTTMTSFYGSSFTFKS